MNNCLSSLRKMLKFGLFNFALLLSISVTGAENEVMVIDHYRLYHAEGDRELVQRIYNRIQQPLNRIENFFNRRSWSTVSIILTRSEEEYNRISAGQVPEWSQAVAIPDQSLIILKLEAAESVNRSPQILLHELVHLYLDQQYPEARIPAWLHEGLADYLSSDQLSLPEKIRLSNAVSTRRLLSLGELEQLIHFRSGKAQLAYAEALTAVEYLVREHSEADIRRLLESLNARMTIEDAFVQALGYDYLDFELSWLEDIHQRYRWLVILNVENLLWLGGSLLAIVAIIVIRLRNRRKMKEWEEEDTDSQILKGE